MGLNKWTLTFLLLTSAFFLNNGYAKTSQAFTEKHMLSENEERDLVRYLDRVLIEAGVPDDARHYLIDISRPNLSKIDEKDFAAKKELLRRNLFILLIDLGSKKPLLLSTNKMIYSANEHQIASAQFLSVEHLSFLKSNQVFDGLEVTDIKMIFKSLCPMWPWC